jgi:hypothetical protein
VVGDLGGGEFGDGGQDTEGVAGQEDDVLGVGSETGDLGVGDEFW